MRPPWQALTIGLALLGSVGLGIVTGLAMRYLRGLLESGEPREVTLALNASAALVVYVLAALWKGQEVAERVVLPVIATLVLAMGLIAVLTGVGTGSGAVVVLAFIAAGATVIFLSSLVRAVAGTVTTTMFVVVALAGGLAGGLVGGGIAAFILAMSSAMIGRRAVSRNPRYPALTRLTVRVACRRGTDFRGADLSNADFTGAELASCDFRGANLSRTHWDGAHLRMCLFDGDRDDPPIARHPHVRQTGPGESRDQAST